MIEPADKPPEESHAALLRRIASGDEAALEKLYASTSPKVAARALRILRQREEAEEATLDVYTQAWRRARDYDAGRGTVLAWLLALTRARAIDRLRATRGARTAEQVLEHDLPAPDGENGGERGPAEAAVAAERAGRVQVALARISDDQRRAICAAYFSGLTHAQIALTLGIPLGTVKRRIRSGLEQLRQLLMTHREGVA
jgi:RNA polymerase sigma-70 factor (ECF subfamily)